MTQLDEPQARGLTAVLLRIALACVAGSVAVALGATTGVALGVVAGVAGVGLLTLGRLPWTSAVSALSTRDEQSRFVRLTARAGLVAATLSVGAAAGAFALGASSETPTAMSPATVLEGVPTPREPVTLMALRVGPLPTPTPVPTPESVLPDSPGSLSTPGSEEPAPAAFAPAAPTPAAASGSASGSSPTQQTDGKGQKPKPKPTQGPAPEPPVETPADTPIDQLIGTILGQP